MKLLLLIFLVFGLVSLSAETPTLEQLLESVKSVEDPVERKKLEAKIRKMHEARKRLVPSDYASETTKQLIERVLRGAPMDPTQSDLIKNVLRQREDFKELVRKGVEGFDVALFKHPNPSVVRIGEPYTYAGLASAGGKDFQIEIIKKCIDHPIVVRMREDGIPPLLGMLVQVSDKNEESVLDRLIEQKRITKGSALEKEWRKKLVADSRQTTRSQHPRPRDHLESERNEKTGNPVASTDDSQSKWIIISAMMCVVAGLIFWFKSKSGKGSSREQGGTRRGL